MIAGFVVKWHKFSTLNTNDLKKQTEIQEYSFFLTEDSDQNVLFIRISAFA
jgi:hypothetical protein